MLRGGLQRLLDGNRHITGLGEALPDLILQRSPPLRRRNASAPAHGGLHAHDTDGLPAPPRSQ